MSDVSRSGLSIPAGLQLLLRDLEFLAQVTPGQTPCITSRAIVNPKSVTGKFYRWRHSEDRNATITKVEQIINRTIEAIQDNRNAEYIGIIIDYFARARVGVNAMYSTYNDDPDMKASINVQLNNIDLQLSQYKHLIKGYSASPVNTLPVNTLPVNTLPENTDNVTPIVSVDSVVSNGDTLSDIDKKLRKHRSRRYDQSTAE